MRRDGFSRAGSPRSQEVTSHFPFAGWKPALPGKRGGVDTGRFLWDNPPHRGFVHLDKQPSQRSVNDIASDPAAFFSKTVFVPDLKAVDKLGVLSALADAAAAAGMFPPEKRDEVLRALVEREKTMSTGMQYGVAIPHARTDVVDGLATLVAVSHDGIPFDALDGEPSTIFIVTLSPPQDANSHIRFLAAMTRELSSRRVRENVLAARDKNELIAAFSRPEN